MKKSGVVVVVSGSSGVGKDTIIDIVTSCSDFARFPGYTTREPRPNEIQGIHYNFVKKEIFMSFLIKNELLDCYIVDDFYYGIPIKELNETLENGNNIIIHLSIEGTVLLKNVIPNAITVFVMPPSQKEIINRLRNRGLTEEQIISRTNADMTNINEVYSYDFIVVNHTNQEQMVAKQIIEFISNNPIE